MNKRLEIKKMQVELMRVEAARCEMEYKIEERLDDVKRLEEHIITQKQKEQELKQRIKEMGE